MSACDLLIIGGGPGGYTAAIRARQLGMRVGLVERDALGGTCLNRGCIPTKTYYHQAALARQLREAEKYSFQVQWQFDMAAARARKDKIVAGLAGGIAGLLRGNKVEVRTGEAHLLGPGRVLVDGEELTASRVLLATGSQVSRPSLPGADLPGVLTSDEMLDLDRVPASLVVIGGGVVGLELAGIMNALGSRVTVLELLPEILPTLDREIVRRLMLALKKQGITLVTGAAVTGIRQQDGLLQVDYTVGGKEQSAAGEMVLLSAGRRPCTDGVAASGLALDGKGFVQVDENYRTSLPGVYAVGDVKGGYMLAHVAAEEGVAAVENMAGHTARVAYHAVPACLFTFPEVATVGLAQEAATAQGINCRIGRFSFAASGMASAMGETEGMVKVVAGEDGTVLGVHILGPQAAEIIPAASLLVRQGARIEDVAGTIFPHPVLGEALREAVLAAAGRAIHTLPGR